MVRAVQILGATVRRFSDRLDISGTAGTVLLQKDEIDAGNSGIVLRFCSALAALGCSPMNVTGDDSVRSHRPMGDLVAGLRQLGVSVECQDQFAPLTLCGPLHSGKAFVDGKDSQPVSALIIAAAFAQEPVEIFVRDPGEKPWVDLTLHWLDRLGIPYERRGYGWYRLGRQGSGRYQGFEYTVPGDFSSAAFPIAASLVTDSELSITGLDSNDLQGDRALIPVLQKMGAKIEWLSGTLYVHAGGRLLGADIDVNAIIDAIPIVSVVACYAKGQTRLYNGAVARDKECDRIHDTVTELRKLGADVVETDDGMVIQGSSLQGASVYSHNDHRLAMSLCVAGLGAEGETVVESFGCVEKTYPSFLQDFQKVGADMADSRTIILCGLPKSGKTTVGEEMARQLGWSFIDTDRLVERAYGKHLSCREIFIREGEEYFRRLEREQVFALRGTSDAVISLGGGSLGDAAMERFIRSLGFVIYLNIPPKEAWERIVQQGRPAYVTDHGFEQLAAERIRVFERVAHRTIEISGLTVSQTVTYGKNSIWQVTPSEKSLQS